MSSETQLLFAILCMGLATYGTRLGGYWLLQGRPITGRARAALDAVPPAILTAVIAPAVFLKGWPEMVAGVVTMVAAMLRLPLLVTIAIGVGSIALIRLLT